jgi:low affinity Fe/Cu permease
VKDGHSSRVSSALHAVDSWTSKAWLAASLSVLSGAVLAICIATGSNTAVTDLAAVIQVVTLVMVFVVQHTQARDQRITHRKLDELLQASPSADNSMVMLESGNDDDLERASRRHEERSPYG